MLNHISEKTSKPSKRI